MQALRIAARGMAGQQMNVEVISNHTANMNTVALKRQRAEFQDLLYQNLKRVGATSSDAGTIIPTGVQVGLGVKTGSVYRIAEQGNLMMTHNNYDIAIQGQGYFRVTLPSGETAYTRSGSFQLSPTGEMVTQEGYQLQPGVVIPQDAVGVSIDATGQVSVKIAGQVAPTQVGQLDLAIFFNPAGLEAMGDNLFMQSGSSVEPIPGPPGAAGFGPLLQGYTEASNVDAVSEITALIVAQRAYEMNSKVITTADEMLQAANQVKS